MSNIHPERRGPVLYFINYGLKFSNTSPYVFLLFYSSLYTVNQLKFYFLGVSHAFLSVYHRHDPAATVSALSRELVCLTNSRAPNLSAQPSSHNFAHHIRQLACTCTWQLARQCTTSPFQPCTTASHYPPIISSWRTKFPFPIPHFFPTPES
jgi:hypothetical protein